MEGDCQTSYKQGKLTVHNLTMEKDAVLRISIGRNNCTINEKGEVVNCMQADTLVVQDSVFMFDKVPLVVLPETEYLEEGCYLFLEYGDTLGLTSEYVKHFELTMQKYGDFFFGLDFSTPGKVYLCVSTVSVPVIQRYIDLPLVDGVVTYPTVGRHFVKGSKDFSFTATFTGEPLEVKAVGTYSFQTRNLDANAEILGNNYYRYTIRSVVEPWTVYIGPGPSTVANDGIHNQRVWAHKNILYVNAEMDDIVSIFNMTGVLFRKEEIPAGLKTFTLERGVYVVTLKDGSVHKVVIK
jgi:hypothetical protein